MLKLKNIILEVLQTEQEEDVLEFPNENFTVSIDRNKRKLIFAPQEHSSLPSKLRTMLTMLKQRFNIVNINSLEDENDAGSGDVDDPNLRGVFEVEVDPRENFDSVIQFVKTEAEN